MNPNPKSKIPNLKSHLAFGLLLCAPLAQAAVTVSNVSAAQTPGTRQVVITYDVSSTEKWIVAVTLAVSNGGTPVPAISLSGHIGAGVAIGTGKRIVWNAGADWNGNVATLAYSVTVDDGGSPPPVSTMVLVPGGMTAGITVSSFRIGKHEVTWGEWQSVRTYAATKGYDIGSIGGGSAADHPVNSVNWYDCVKWCNAKSEMDGRTPCYTVGGVTYKAGSYGFNGSGVVACNFAANGYYRLPTEAEWEFAARGGTQSLGTTYSGGNDLNAAGWYWDNSSGAAVSLQQDHGTWPVGLKAANELGLHDMSGNVSEWCFDLYLGLEYYFPRVTRGGSWYSSAYYCTVSNRGYGFPDDRCTIYGSGFRLACPAGE